MSCCLWVSYRYRVVLYRVKMSPKIVMGHYTESRCHENSYNIRNFIARVSQ